MQSWVQGKLRSYAQKIIARQKPKVVAITGSVGKTTAKEAIAAVLTSHFAARSSYKNYNNELGLPLTILGEKSPGRSAVGWLRVLWKAARLARRKSAHYPRWLVLEMGADRKGDIAYLAQIAPPDIAVVTAVSPAHTQFLGTLGEVAEEKCTLVRNLKEGGIAILNGDDLYTRDMAHDCAGQALLYGFGDEQVRADDVSMDFADGGVWPLGMRGFLHYQGGERGQFVIHGTVGRHVIYPIMAAAAVGIVAGLALHQIIEGLRHYSPPPGRMRLLGGIKGTLLIDDTYNSSPQAAIAAIETLAEITPREGGERYAVLGDMLELGNMAVEAHAAVGRRVAELPLAFLITVGELGKEIARAARSAGMPEHRMAQFAAAPEAGIFLQGKMETGDVVLVKGSQAVRMEKIVREVMADPLSATKVLVRMDEEWEGR